MTKLVLLDRDGVINVEIEGYVKSSEELDIMPQALEALALFKQEGWTPVIITNQSVVGRGIITRQQLDEIHSFLIQTAEQHGGFVADVNVCTDRPDHATDRRKPGAGMLLETLQKFKAKADATPFVGDAITDMEAAHKAGCRRYLVMTGKGKETAQKLTPALQPVTVCNDILDAARKITGRES